MILASTPIDQIYADTDQIISYFKLQLSRSFAIAELRMNGSHASLCIPSRSLKLFERAVSKVFQFPKLFLF